jgi:hypothetical protein
MIPVKTPPGKGMSAAESIRDPYSQETLRPEVALRERAAPVALDVAGAA